jgi:uncharacterized protein
VKSLERQPFAFHLLAKPSGAACNLDCKYCYFLSKGALYPGSQFRMGDELLELYVRQLLESQPESKVTIAWQGGEPTLMGLDFFRRAVQYVEKYRQSGQRIFYTLQTNGTLINSDWAAFFREHKFLIGLSIDGPQAMHDAYRVDKGGRGSFERVMRGWEALRNILCTLHSANADYPLEVYRFFRDGLGAQFIQFIPIVERVTPENLSIANQGWRASVDGERPLYIQAGDQVTERSIKPEQYGRFLVTIFEEWIRRDVGEVFVQMFEVALGNWMGKRTLCVFSPTCGNALVLEHNGDVYACDHFVEPDFLLGNIYESHLAELVTLPKQLHFGLAKQDALPGVCRECEVLAACYGGCPKDRFLHTTQGEPGLNYLCEGYRLFFRHVARPMRIMADLLRGGHAAGEIMNLLTMEELRKAQQGEEAGKIAHPGLQRGGKESGGWQAVSHQIKRKKRKRSR